MRTYLAGILVLLAVVCGCGGGKKAPEPPPLAKALETGEGDTALAGTQWKVGTATLRFEDASNVVVSGGEGVQVQDLRVRYILKNGELLIKTPFSMREGTYDGTTLILEKETGVRE